jgi:hypothetical protein
MEIIELVIKLNKELTLNLRDLHQNKEKPLDRGI